MLINGATLGYGDEEGTYTKLKGLVEVPDFGGTPNKIDHSAIDDEYKQYEIGQKDLGDLVFKFRYRTDEEKEQFKTLQGFETSNAIKYWDFELSDGFKVEFQASCAIGLNTAGGPDTPVDYSITLGLASDIKYTPYSAPVI